MYILIMEMLNDSQEQDETDEPQCMYCGASLKKRGEVKGFSIVCSDCKAIL